MTPLQTLRRSFVELGKAMYEASWVLGGIFVLAFVLGRCSV